MQRLKYERKEIITKLSIAKSLCTVTTVDANVIDRTLQSDFVDLEDAMQYYSALASNAEVIITRNEKDFAAANILVQNPIEFIGN